MMDQSVSVEAPLVKAVSGWAAILGALGISSWSDAASAATFFAAGVAMLYNVALFAELITKRLRTRTRRTRDTDETAARLNPDPDVSVDSARTR